MDCSSVPGGNLPCLLGPDGSTKGKGNLTPPQGCVEDLLILPPLQWDASTEWQLIQWEVIREAIRQNSLIYGPLSLSQQLPHLIPARFI